MPETESLSSEASERSSGDRSSGAIYNNLDQLRAAVVEALRAQGLTLSQKVVCVAGEPDIVTTSHDAIYEVRYQLTHEVLCQALGEVLLFRACINSHARAFLIGYVTPEALVLQPFVQSLGVNLIFWGVPSAADMLVPQGVAQAISSRAISQSVAAAALTWNIDRIARAQGIGSVPKLAARLGVSRQGLYAIWRGEAVQISIELLSRLARTLHIDPGDWFTWSNESGKPLLEWSIRAEAEARDLDRIRLGFRAELHQTSIGPIWDGRAQAVQLPSLARLAQSLDTPTQPFSIGELVRWKR